MAVPYTYATLIDLNFGYLTGQDLVDYCPFQLLVNSELQNPGIMQRTCIRASDEMENQLITKCDLKDEYLKTGTGRSPAVVKLTALTAIKNIVAVLPELPVNTKENLLYLKETISAIRQGQYSLPNVMISQGGTDEKGHPIPLYSEAQLVRQKYNSR